MIIIFEKIKDKILSIYFNHTNIEMDNDNLYSRMYIPTETKRRLLGELFEQFCEEHSLQEDLLKTIDQSEIWICENHLKFLYVLLKVTEVNLEYQTKLKEIKQALISATNEKKIDSE